MSYRSIPFDAGQERGRSRAYFAFLNADSMLGTYRSLLEIHWHYKLTQMVKSDTTLLLNKANAKVAMFNLPSKTLFPLHTEAM